MLRICALVLLALLFGINGGTASGAEPWADERLPVHEGLQLWIDAAQQTAARQVQGEGAVSDGTPLSIVYDASGRGRHLVQEDEDARPRIAAVPGGHVLRFDGGDDHLRWTGGENAFAEMTVILVGTAYSNPGGFRAFLAANRKGANDYESRITIDQGSPGTPRFSRLNVEGRGFQGEQDILSGDSDFGAVHVLTVTTAPGPKGTKLYVDGQLSGERDRSPGQVAMNEVTLGARYYGHGRPPQVTGHLEGDLAEVLVFNRVLSESERQNIEEYLTEKHQQLLETKLERPAPAEGKRLVRVECPPVQMFVPGFTTHKLPVDLPNCNNVLYRPDGKLVVLAYNGDIYLLSDTDGDGLEDRAELFWESNGRLQAPIGMALTPPGYSRGEGVFVPSKGKCSLIVDTDGDDRADREIVVAEGWTQLPHGVDALGVAVDPDDQSIYFGLGTTNFADAYLIDDQGRSHYRLDSERGTILRVAPDFQSREIVCTGIRFPVALRFNRHGDLFCTDQEGATWLPNGNPFDELLHIREGRHYGFPPRHPRYLPEVIDEPSVMNYKPQHQSTCGLNFNEPVNGGPVFGPEFWAGDALVSGYSRGKLFRTQVVKTPAGYVARNSVLAALNRLTVDACVSPQGNLVVATHSGTPDWGTGPSGPGTLYKVKYADPQAPQPVLAWPQTPHEVRITFDRPLDPEQLRDAASRISIDYGRYVSAGDRFEALRPGYQVVADQMTAPRYELGVHGVQMTPDRRTLIVATDRHPAALRYAVTLSQIHRDEPAEGLRQVPEVDLDYGLTGVQATWQSPDGKTEWTGWLPHLDLQAARELTQASAPHEELWGLLRRPGTLTLKTKLDLWHMLRPAVQPGSTIDYTWPEERVTVTFRPAAEIELQAEGAEVISGGEAVRLRCVPQKNEPIPVRLTIETGGEPPSLQVSFHTNEDDRPRPLSLERILLPWAEPRPEPAERSARQPHPELEGGSWARGRKVFFGEKATCSRCHSIRGEGGEIGADLSNLMHRDYASVMRDIRKPSFAINPDFVTYNAVLTDGRVVTGTLRSEGDRLHIGTQDGEVVTVSRDEVDRLKASAVSTMPKQLLKQLSPEETRDLMTFLLTRPPHMPDYGPHDPPPPRTQAEVDAVLAGGPPSKSPPEPLQIVLVAGPKDHGPGEHDYPAWQSAWKELLQAAERVRVETAWEWPEPKQFETADVLVFYQRGTWTPDRAEQMDAYLARGGGAVLIHYAVDGRADPDGFAKRIGLAWKGGHSRFRHGPLELNFAREAEHPILRNFETLHLRDESYWKLLGKQDRIQVLATGTEDGAPRPLVWTREHEKGRVFVSIPGHYSWTFDDPLFRVLLLRGIAWSAGRPVDRLNAAVRPGSRIE